MREILAMMFVMAGCATTGAGGPSSNPTSGGVSGESAPAHGTLGAARPLPAGPAIRIAIGCDANFFVGPFNHARSGESTRLVSTIRSADGSQVCGVSGHFVDGNGAPAATSGFGCAEGPNPMSGEPQYDYSPDNGGNGANPVFLHIERHDPAGCATVELSLARR